MSVSICRVGHARSCAPDCAHYACPARFAQPAQGEPSHKPQSLFRPTPEAYCLASMNTVQTSPLPARPLALPNLLTYARIAAVPVVVGLLYWQSIFDGPLWLRWVALAFFISAGVTDILDGYLARTWGQQSSLGRMLDP